MRRAGKGWDWKGWADTFGAGRGRWRSLKNGESTESGETWNRTWEAGFKRARPSTVEPGEF